MEVQGHEDRSKAEVRGVGDRGEQGQEAEGGVGGPGLGAPAGR